MVLSFCHCEPVAPPPTGGVTLEEVHGESGQLCGRGLAVLTTDYVSTSVGIVDFEGRTQSGSILSSASTRALLNAPLGGDVVLPHVWAKDELVLIDRFPTSVLTFLELETGEVRGQLDVGRGFASNPQDYLELDARRALVSRYETNPDREASPIDRGDDVLLIDRVELRVSGSIDLSAARLPGYQARPGRLLRVGDRVLVTLSGYDADFSSAARGRIAILDPQALTVVDVVEIPDVKNCGSLSLSPSGAELAVGCSGLVDGGDEAAPGDSAVVRFQVERGAEGELRLRERARHSARDFELGPLGYGLAYASEERLLVSAYGAVEGADAGRADAVILLDLARDEHTRLLSSEARAFTLGQLECVPACGLCFVADAGRGQVHRLRFDDSGLVERRAFSLKDAIGLPPRHLSRL